MTMSGEVIRLSVIAVNDSDFQWRNGVVSTSPEVGGDHLEDVWYPDIEGMVRILLYSIIFFLGLLGNCLVIITIARNRRLRIVTNVFLLNLAVSDLLLGVFCMPFTLVGALLREFIFGELMCKVISYLQGTSVAVNAWTLVAISMERYYAVCEPLKSRRWQTISHAYKSIGVIWFASLCLMFPIAFVSHLLARDSPGERKYKCREIWPSDVWERAFNILLDCTLLFVPLVVMATAYSRICYILRRGIRENDNCSISLYSNKRNSSSAFAVSGSTAPGSYSRQTSLEDSTKKNQVYMSVKWGKSVQGCKASKDPVEEYSMSIRSTNLDQRLAVKRKIIRMLFVVVLEFFICWTPIYVINTVSSFDADIVYGNIGYIGISFLHLLSYVSSCCNPITYCFMNRNFRQEFLQTFTRLCEKKKSRMRKTVCSVNGAAMRSSVPLNRAKLDNDVI